MNWIYELEDMYMLYIYMKYYGIWVGYCRNSNGILVAYYWDVNGYQCDINGHSWHIN